MYLNEANCYNLLLFDCVRRTNMHGVEILHNEHTNTYIICKNVKKNIYYGKLTIFILLINNYSFHI